MKNKIITQDVRIHILFLVIAVAWIGSGCEGDTIQSAAGGIDTDTSPRIEQALTRDIDLEMAKAEARIREFESFRNGNGTFPANNARQKRTVTVVHPGESIQSAVDAANPGALLLIKPGIYTEAVTITTSNITLIGLGGANGAEVIIENPGDAEDGIRVEPGEGAESIEGFALYNVTVRDFEENGVFLVHTNNYFIAKVTTIDSGEYGIYPVFSNNGVVFRSSAEGHTDAGIYIGQSEYAWVLNNSAYANVIGIEIENASNIFVAHNRSFDNTIGILSVLLPPSPHITVTESNRVTLAHNELFGNNRDNFAEPGELASFVPKGVGAMVMGVDNALVVQNRVAGNDLIGLGLGSTLIFAALAGLPPEAFAGIDPDPDNAAFKLNKLFNNGTSPPPLPAPLAGIESDLFWDGSGDNNCWWNNDYTTSFPPQLPQCPSPGL